MATDEKTKRERGEPTEGAELEPARRKLKEPPARLAMLRARAAQRTPPTSAELLERGMRQVNGAGIGQRRKASRPSMAAAELEREASPEPSLSGASVASSDAATEPAPRLRKRQRRALAKNTRRKEG